MTGTDASRAMGSKMLNDSKKIKILLIAAVIVLAILGTTIKGLVKQNTKKPSRSQAVVYQVPDPKYPSPSLLG